jgi:hypothetical protein
MAGAASTIHIDLWDDLSWDVNVRALERLEDESTLDLNVCNRIQELAVSQWQGQRCKAWMTLLRPVSNGLWTLHNLTSLSLGQRAMAKALKDSNGPWRCATSGSNTRHLRQLRSMASLVPASKLLSSDCCYLKIWLFMAWHERRRSGFKFQRPTPSLRILEAPPPFMYYSALDARANTSQHRESRTLTQLMEVSLWSDPPLSPVGCRGSRHKS